jgi:hypothetical protein
MPDFPDTLDFSSAAQYVCEKLGVSGCVLVTSHPDGSVGFMGHGVNHAKANELLSVGIHINLTQHDQMVRDGAAGEDAQRKANLIREQGGVA